MLAAIRQSGKVSLIGPHGLSGNANVEELQKALTALSAASSWAAVNPGTTSGEVTAQTVYAVGAVIGQLSGKIDSSVKTAVEVGVFAASLSTTAMATAKTLITQYAPWLTPAIRAFTIKYSIPVAPAPPPPPPIAPPAGGGYSQGGSVPWIPASAPQLPFFRASNPAVWGIGGVGLVLLYMAIRGGGKPAHA